MTSVFLTGGNGYLGAYVCAQLLGDTPDLHLHLLIRATTKRQAHEKLWANWQLHMDLETFRERLSRVTLVFGDLHGTRLSLSDQDYDDVLSSCDSVLHIAASLNRKSSKSCFNTNLRGTLSVIKLAAAMEKAGVLRRYSHVSTVAVAGQRDREVIEEDTAIEWDRSDYDPYGRTKKFCEHMARELLPAGKVMFFRPSIVMGDSRFAGTTQFDMIRAFCLIADLPIVPLRPDIRLDIINADYVGAAIAHIHMKADAKWDIYHLSSGTSSKTAQEIAHALIAGQTRRGVRFVRQLEGSFSKTVNAMTMAPRNSPIALPAALLKVFLPYITYDTVFDNQRVVTEMGRAPTEFTDYCAELYRFAKGCSYQYPSEALPEDFVCNG
jgi:thioester reductase-like protein